MPDRPLPERTPRVEEGPALEDLWQEREAMLAKIARLASALAVIMEAPRSTCARCEEAARVAREALR